MVTINTLPERLQRASVLDIECTIPAGMTLAEWRDRKRSTEPRKLRVRRHGRAAS
jgi:hypothetical protein